MQCNRDNQDKKQMEIKYFIIEKEEKICVVLTTKQKSRKVKKEKHCARFNSFRGK